jgi:WD40 repeat protein
MALVSNKLFFGDNDEQMLIGTSFYDSSSIPLYVGILTHPSAAASDNFGFSVAVGSGRIVVGAPFDNIDALTDAGSAHIYDLNGGYVGIITHPSAVASDRFGYSVAVGSGRIVVGAPLDDIGIGLTNAGSAHIYDLNGGYVGIITHPSAAANDQFGNSVAVGSGRIVVGIPFDNSAHIYDLNGGYVGIITHPSAAAFDGFGYSVAVGSGRIVVGAYLDNIGTLSDAGSAHIYDLNGNYVGIITHPSAAASDNFGDSVAVGSGRIVVGAPFDNIDALTDAGSAHIYSIPNQDHILDILDDNK